VYSTVLLLGISCEHGGGAVEPVQGSKREVVVSQSPKSWFNSGQAADPISRSGERSWHPIVVEASEQTTNGFGRKQFSFLDLTFGGLRDEGIFVDSK
jgi:hypothetical protein